MIGEDNSKANKEVDLMEEKKKSHNFAEGDCKEGNIC